MRDLARLCDSNVLAVPTYACRRSRRLAASRRPKALPTELAARITLVAPSLLRSASIRSIASRRNRSKLSSPSTAGPLRCEKPALRAVDDGGDIATGGHLARLAVGSTCARQVPGGGNQSRHRAPCRVGCPQQTRCGCTERKGAMEPTCGHRAASGRPALSGSGTRASPQAARRLPGDAGLPGAGRHSLAGEGPAWARRARLSASAFTGCNCSDCICRCT
jgi:hypothetical protein